MVYKGIKSIPESDIASAFSNERIGLSGGTWFDQNELAHGAASGPWMPLCYRKAKLFSERGNGSI
jgi:hypothetical protein